MKDLRILDDSKDVGCISPRRPLLFLIISKWLIYKVESYDEVQNLKSCTFSLRSSSPLNEEAQKAWLGTTTSNVSLCLWVGSTFLITLIKLLIIQCHHTSLPVVPPLGGGGGVKDLHVFAVIFIHTNLFRGDHAEGVVVYYDPSVTSYEDMLKIFWEIHDPTKPRSKQYMSAIFYHTEQQKELAEKSMERQQKLLSKKILTEIIPASAIYNAEE